MDAWLGLRRIPAAGIDACAVGANLVFALVWECKGEHNGKSYTAAFKAKVALEAIKGQRTINEIASAYEVHPNQVTQWKKQAVSQLSDIFSNGRARDDAADEELRNQLYQQIGQLKVELDWLKKKSGL